MWMLTIVFGAALAALGLGGYAWTGAVTSLIPAGFGLVLALCGALAAKEELRKHAMHAAAAVGLIGFLIPAVMAGPKLPALLSQGHVARADGSDATRAVVMQLVMALICLAFVALCVNSFVQARLLRRKVGTPDPHAPA